MGNQVFAAGDVHPRGAASDKYGVYLADKGILRPSDRHREQSRKSGVVLEL